MRRFLNQPIIRSVSEGTRGRGRLEYLRISRDELPAAMETTAVAGPRLIR